MTVITLIPGDGVGKEITDSVKQVFKAMQLDIKWDEQQAGAEVFKAGLATGVPLETIASIKQNKVVLKGPLMTPVGFGEKSANVTLRKFFNTYGNIRPVREMPGIETPYTGRQLDFVIVRENLEDLYAGIEYMTAPGIQASIKLATKRGSEKICRLAFEVARAEGRKSVHCATKANILKFTEGYLKKTFERVAKDYPDIEAHHLIIDNCAHQLAIRPEQFEVIVCSNLHGDIISDQAAGLVGGLGLASSSNVGDDISIFEAVHGSAPDIEGKGLVNPTAMLLTASLLLKHIGELDAAKTLENAVLKTLEEKQVRTKDIALPGQDAAGTQAMTDAVIANLGQVPHTMSARPASQLNMPKGHVEDDQVNVHDIGFDVFLDEASLCDPNELGAAIEALVADTAVQLKYISNRGVVVYPNKDVAPNCVNWWRCRFVRRDDQAEIDQATIMDVLAKIGAQYRWTTVQRLAEFDGEAGASKAQGEV